MIRIGTRKSQLAVLQSEIVKKKILDKFDYQVEIVPITSIGDEDQISLLSSYRGQGVFTGKIERYLLEGKIDVAVHSLKDLPIVDTPGLQIIAYIKRHDPRDCLLIKEEYIKEINSLKLKSGARIATGSPRRQSQLNAHDPSLVLLDIRGNVNTRVAKLKTSFVDGLVMAAAVFDRMDLELPDGVVKIMLPLDRFPSAPGQGIIAVQVRTDELIELSEIGDEFTKISAISERQFLSSIGGGCDIAVGISTEFRDKFWHLHCSAPRTTRFNSPLSIYSYKGTDLHALFNQLSIAIKTETIPALNKRVIVARDSKEATEYTELLIESGCLVSDMKILDLQYDYLFLENEEFKNKWKEADWIIISSKRAVAYLHLIHHLLSRKAYRIGVTGSATARELRNYGLPVHFVANGGMNELSKTLNEVRKVYPGKVLYLAAKNYTAKPSEDADIVQIYHTDIVSFEPAFKPDYMVVFSSRSAKAIIDKLGSNYCHFIAIGNTTGAYLQSTGCKYSVAKKPTARAVLEEML